VTAQPTISVIIPVFNGAAFLGDAIRSVMAQNHHPLEIIVVDDGSIDATGEVAASFGDAILYHRQENAGAPAARNQGMSMSSGEFVALLDADDLFVPGKFVQQLARFDRHPESGIVIGRQVHESLADGEKLIIERSAERADGLSLQLGCALFRREAFDKVGVFNVALRHCDDWDWFLRAREMGVGIVIHRDVVLRQRVHENNLTRQRDEGARYQRMAFKLSIDRRRANGGKAASLPALASFLEPLQEPTRTDT
jgi:glycosyltransferase involved in cell wall biosynthesis